MQLRIIANANRVLVDITGSEKSWERDLVLICIVDTHNVTAFEVGKI